jgi:hypothetical protein
VRWESDSFEGLAKMDGEAPPSIFALFPCPSGGGAENFREFKNPGSFNAAFSKSGLGVLVVGEADHQYPKISFFRRACPTQLAGKPPAMGVRRESGRGFRKVSHFEKTLSRSTIGIDKF